MCWAQGHWGAEMLSSALAAVPCDGFWCQRWGEEASLLAVQGWEKHLSASPAHTEPDISAGSLTARREKQRVTHIPQTGPEVCRVTQPPEVLILCHCCLPGMSNGCGQRRQTHLGCPRGTWARQESPAGEDGCAGRPREMTQKDLICLPGGVLRLSHREGGKQHCSHSSSQSHQPPLPAPSLPVPAPTKLQASHQ